MRQISMALQTYATNNNGQLPPAYIADENGRPMHSWRVLLLPYMEQQALYDRYNFDEPWNGPNNSRLAGEIPQLYQCPDDDRPRGDSQRPWTSYVVVVGPNTIWPGTESGGLDRIPDGSDRTLLLVEVRDSGINWMEPRDLTLEEMNPRINGEGRLGISSVHPNVAHFMFADGHGGPLSDDLKPDTLRQLIQIDDGAPSYTDF
ncbi:MAG: DUF1559 domain-containing protein [Planctomycetaceae bacterium]|nr:DUF1559 domain-containing protein [Planctomycetaceae bacterium]